MLSSIFPKALQNFKLIPSFSNIYVLRTSQSVYSIHKASIHIKTYDGNYYKSSYKDYNTNRKQSRSSNYFSLVQAIYLGLGISIGFSICNFFTKDKYRILDFLNSRGFIPSINAASPFSYLNKENEKDLKNSQTKTGIRSSCNFIADVVEKVSDGVVLIEIKDHRRRDYMGRVPAMTNGSGFIINQNGLILTNAHVVANKPRTSSIMVRLPDGKEYEGKIEELDAISDLALVRVKASDLKPLNLGSSKDLRPGEFVVALGSPFSLSNTITSGVISSVGRASKDLGLRGKDIAYIQTDAAITFGNSGGPLVNLDGEVIGINSMKVTSGISFAIPVDHAKDFIAKAEKKRKSIAKYKSEDEEDIAVKRRYLGITMLTLTQEIIMQMQQRTPGSQIHQIPDSLSHGILVWRVVIGSPAYHAGLEPGDIVTHINGHEIHSSRDVYKILEGKTDLNMVVIRKGQKYSVSVAPEE